MKFLRFGQVVIEGAGAGVLGYITNHGYLDNPTFRGVRQSLMGTFRQIRVLDLHGNANKEEPDFAVTVDYAVPVFPGDASDPNAFSEALLTILPAPAAIPESSPYFFLARVIRGIGQQVIAASAAGFYVETPYLAGSGRLRVTRTGTTITAWYAAPGSETFDSLASWGGSGRTRADSA